MPQVHPQAPTRVQQPAEGGMDMKAWEAKHNTKVIELYWYLFDMLKLVLVGEGHLQ